jgi:hypothetical protein
VRWVTYESTDGQRVGLIDGDKMVGLAAGSSLLDLLAAGTGSMADAALSAQLSPSEVHPDGTSTKQPASSPGPRPDNQPTTSTHETPSATAEVVASGRRRRQ